MEACNWHAYQRLSGLLGDLEAAFSGSKRLIKKGIKAVKVRIQKQGIRLLTRCSSCEHIVARVSGKEPETVSLTLHCHSCSLIENTQSGVHQGN